MPTAEYGEELFHVLIELESGAAHASKPWPVKLVLPATTESAETSDLGCWPAVGDTPEVEVLGVLGAFGVLDVLGVLGVPDAGSAALARMDWASARSPL